MMTALLRKSLAALASLCYPQNNCCHLCSQPLRTLGEQWLCEPCQKALDEAALDPGEQPFFLHELIPCSYAGFAHEGAAKELAQALKYNGDRFCALPLAQGMATVFALDCAGSLRKSDFFLPIPLHPSRERMRGFNQAETLCQSLSFHTGLPVIPTALRRVRATRPQVGLDSAQRRNNLHGAFEVADIQAVYGKRIALVDDVCTTGSTAVACAQVLKAFGAKEVCLLTACKA